MSIPHARARVRAHGLWSHRAPLMNKNYTEIVFILDRSGSMRSCRDAAIAGFNDLLSEQQQVAGLARLTLVLFSSETRVITDSVPIVEVIPLDRSTYVPSGCTALLDAIGSTIDLLGRRLANISEERRPSRVIVAILTDGVENASQQYSWPNVSARIKEQTETYSWTFLFLGANQDAIATAARLNVRAEHASSFMADEAGARTAIKTASRSITTFRRTSNPNAT